MFFAFWRFFQFFHSFSVTAGRARLSPGRHNRNQTARSVWSAWSLLPLSDVWRGSKAGASSTHSIRFARFGSGYAGLGTDAPYLGAPGALRTGAPLPAGMPALPGSLPMIFVQVIIIKKDYATSHNGS